VSPQTINVDEQLLTEDAEYNVKDISKETVARPDFVLSFKCQECNFKCKEKTNIEKHAQMEHIEDIRYVCSECAKEFGEGEDYQNHMKTHTALSAIALYCEKCDFMTENVNSMNTHRKDSHTYFNVKNASLKQEHKQI
jgi:hypothetical protein